MRECLNYPHVMLDLVIRTILLVGSISLNVRMSPVETMTEVHVFVSSVIILVSCAQALLIYIVYLFLEHCFSIKLDRHQWLVFTPLTVALAKQKDKRRGDFHATSHPGKSLFVLTDATLLDDEGSDSDTGSTTDTRIVSRAVSEAGEAASDRRCEPGAGTGLKIVPSVDDHMNDHMNDRSDEKALDTVLKIGGGTHTPLEPYTGDFSSEFDTDIFFDDLGAVSRETNNVYTDIYLLGIATFCIFYSVDTVSTIPCHSFLIGLTLASVRDVASLVRSIRADMLFNLGLARSITLLSFITIILAQSSLGVVLRMQYRNHVEELNPSFLNIMLSIVLPLLSPCMLLTISPKTTPLVTIQECSPFVVTMALWYIAFFLSLRGHLHSAMSFDNSTAIDIDMGIEMEQSFHLDTAVDHGYNIPWIMFSPIFKVLAMSIIVAAIINRRNLEILCPIQLVLTSRVLLHTLTRDIPDDVGMLQDARTEKRLVVMSFIFTAVACLSTFTKEMLWRHGDMSEDVATTRRRPKSMSD
jgi:hypothetical protein